MGSKQEQFDNKGREKIQCKECSCWYHRLEVHIKAEHGITVVDYNAKHPGAPTISPSARETASRAAKKAQVGLETPKPVSAPSTSIEDDIFGDEDYKVGVARLKMVPDSDLTPTQKAEVPIHDDFWEPGKNEIEYLEQIGVGIQDSDNIFLFGPTGCGKTTIVKQLGAILNTPIIRFQFTNRISVEDFVGEMEIIIDKETGKQVTAWRDGAFTRAWREGYFILLDEITKAQAGILMRLQGPLEGDDLVLIENGGEVVKRHNRTRIFATDNTNGRGDDSGLYVSSNVLDEATLDRFGTVIEYGYPDKASEVKILVKKTGITTALARKMVEVARKIRVALENDECHCTFSTRRLLMWSRKTVRFNNARKAAKVSVLSKLDADDKKFVDGIIQRYFGGEV